ncbi:hypothetical protein M404DRAFT_721361 [Pisolithus tinctorius Marx 270]|uniref:Uncharacterized protein n=1 Tax=Pisolithus tinctorius Marx 270 TaxID=870435 RepID=A0A0C3P3E3_PISTI|nr:hypothetical protein M404DRAFT_721361 [Pisolithus tinctorius Marx 270]
METVVDHLQESIQKSTQALLSKEEAQATADSTRLVPPYNAEATVPSEVYPLHNIIPETEWKTLSEAPFVVVGQNQRIPLLPFQRSKWINQHLHSICDSSSPGKTNIKILQYIAYMMLFWQLATQSNLGQVLCKRS